MSTSNKVLSILGLFSVERSQWTVEQAAHAIGQPVSTTYRHFAVLSKAGLIGPFRGGLYVLGPAAIQLDWLIRKTDPLLNSARPAIKFLTGAVDRPAVVLLCRFYRDQVMCIDQAIAGNPTFAPSYQRGRLMPLARGSPSKIILATLSDRAKKSLQARNGKEFAAAGLGTNWAELRTSLAAIRNAGYSLSRGEIDKGVVGISAPILMAEGMPIGSVSYVISGEKITKAHHDSLEQMVRVLKAAAAQITAALTD
jgi:DNA-binding IclR family transcriptional regulator